MPWVGSLPSSLILRQTSSFLLLFFSNKPSLLSRHARRSVASRSSSSSSLRHNIKLPPFKYLNRRPMTTSTAPPPPTPNPNPKSTRSNKKARQNAPESVLRHQLGMCSRHQNLAEALQLYDAAREQSVPLSIDHYNSLLYLCSLPSSSPSSSPRPPSIPSRGFQIYSHLLREKIAPNEATFTSLARLAQNDRNPDLAFDFVKQMQANSIPPRLRSYGPALFGFCDEGNFDKAREVELHMDANGIVPEEPELRALLKVSVESGRGEEVYRILHRMRSLVRRVSEEMAEVLEGWFGSKFAEGVGKEEWDEGVVKDGMVKGGGGWHGVGWLGGGTWSIGRSEMDKSGVCQRCGEKLVCIDIDPVETKDFAMKLAKLASEKEVRSDFVLFQEWMEQHGPFDAVVDGANVGLYNQHSFSFFQLNSVVNGLQQLSPTKKLPLIVLHSRRVRGGSPDNPKNKKLLESWKRAGALYATPPGSNDDWYWLYAAVSCKSLLVTNDEMRDHLFELLGTSFFPRWKEKHQVHLTFSKHGPNFHMPPAYSIVIQESEEGSWHIPTVTGDDIETPRQWVCATRPSNLVSSLPEPQLAQML